MFIWIAVSNARLLNSPTVLRERMWLRIDDVSVQPTILPTQSTFISTVGGEGFSTYQMSGDGDLWPSCWADDGNLYTANGDGTAFTGNSSRYDMAVSRIAGYPPNLSGSAVATNVGSNWAGSSYNRKPTGNIPHSVAECRHTGGANADR
jgi:hypothetical protein